MRYVYAGFIAMLLILGIVLPASAASPECRAASPAESCLSYDVPIHGSLDLDASDWGGAGFGQSPVANDPVIVWSEASAGYAADFSPMLIPSGVSGYPSTGGPFYELEYTPENQSSNFCVSIVTDVQGSHARLRTCGNRDSADSQPFNPWQAFEITPSGDGFNLICATDFATPLCLNDKAYGGNSTPVIAYPATAGENQLWENNN